MIEPTLGGWIAIAGLVANAIGVIFLFYYGMPYRVRTGGNTINFTVNPANPEIINREAYNDRMGKIGLALIVAGTIAQMASFTIK
jgi:hypothetical protein